MTVNNVFKNDFKLIKRNSVLVFMVFFAAYIGIALRFLLPWADEYFAEVGWLPHVNHSLGFAKYFPVIMSNFNVFTAPVMSGTIFAFLILGEKDEDTLRALLISPLSPKKYVVYRIVASMFLAFAMVLGIFYLTNQAMLPFPHLVLISFAAAFTAPITVLFLVMIAHSRMQGLNYAKVFSFLGYLIMLFWWVKEPFQFILGLFPPFWVSKAYWTALSVTGSFSFEWLFYWSLGIGLQLVATFLLLKIYLKRIYIKL